MHMQLGKFFHKYAGSVLLVVILIGAVVAVGTVRLGFNTSHPRWADGNNQGFISTTLDAELFNFTGLGLKQVFNHKGDSHATIDLPTGQVDLDRRVRIPGNTTLVGHNTVINSDTLAYYVYASNQQNITFKDITFTGMTQIQINATDNYVCKNFKIINCDFELYNSNSTYTIYFQVEAGTIENITIRDSNIHFPAGSGICLRGEPGGALPREYNYVWIENVLVHDTGDSGFDFGMSISESAFCDNATVIGCTVKNTYELGFGGEYGFWGQNNRFIDCTAINCDNGNGAPTYGCGFNIAGDVELINCRTYGNKRGYIVSLENDDTNTRMTGCYSEDDEVGVYVVNGVSGGKLFINGMIVQNVTSKAIDLVYDDTTVMNPYVYADNFYNITGSYVQEFENDYKDFYPSDENLSLYLKFDENTGTRVYDSSQYRNDGEMIQGASWDRGKYGSGIKFDADKEYIRLFDNGSNLNIVDEITLECWVYKTYNTGSGDEGIITKNAFNCYALSASQTSFAIYINGGGHSARVYLEPGSGSRWYHLVGTFDGTTIRVYLDGHLRSQTSYSASIAVSATNPVIIGKNGVGGGEGYTGKIDEVRIYNRTLTPIEVQNHYLRGISANGYIQSNNFTVFDSNWEPWLKVPTTNCSTVWEVGQMWYDVTNHKLMVYEGAGVWKSTTLT